MRYAVAAALLLTPSACAEFRPPAVVMPEVTRDWREVVTEDDRGRLRDWRTAFVEALQAARSAGHSADLAREGELLDPDVALGGGTIPNGNYRCRVIKLGARSPGVLAYVSYPWFACRVAQNGPVQDFAKLGGSQRQVGVVYPSDGLRQVFLGTLVLADEARAMQYGRDTDRDVAGFVERIGPGRWRLIMPRPHFESVMDVMELVPSGEGVR